tara:strand:- start:345 stop:818 length:474 start_codon:yes stop_codon:yes gene_type:complete
MHDITVAFYKGEGLRRDRIVRWWTDSPYSHVELIMPNGDMAGIRPPDDPFVRKRACNTIEETEWELVKLTVTEKQLKALREFIEKTKGQGYDWIGMIISHLTPFRVKIPNKWYCSEWVAYALSVANILKLKQLKLYNLSKMPPGKLYNILRNTRIEP